MSLSVLVVIMDSLPRLGVSNELSHEESSRRLFSARNGEIAKLRLSLFQDAKAKDLVLMNSQLVTPTDMKKVIKEINKTRL